MKKPLIRALEPRILFDGAAITTAIEVLDNTSFNNTTDSTEINDATTPDSNQVNEPVTVEAGDILYLFSDGYADQFGGIKHPNGKKLKTTGMKDLLLSIRNQSMSEQKKSMDVFIENWKGTIEQNDDICVIGLMI